MSKFFLVVRNILAVHNVTTIEYHPHTGGKAERFNTTLIQRLQHYVLKHQTDYGTYVLPLWYGYDVLVHMFIKVSLLARCLRKPSLDGAWSYQNVHT